MLTRRVTIGAAVRYVAEETGYSPDIVYRWRQGHSRPTDETLVQLVQLGQAANLERAWGVALFTAAGSSATQADALWEPREERDIPHNMPAPGYTRFIGRADELAHLLAYLSPERGAHLISVDGIGGVGKTALTLEAAYRCLRASRAAADHGPVPTFDAIIFVSAKRRPCSPHTASCCATKPSAPCKTCSTKSPASSTARKSPASRRKSSRPPHAAP